MNITLFFILAALALWAVRLELGLRLHRRHLMRLFSSFADCCNAHNKLRMRFELFMTQGGQEAVKKHFESVWAKGNHLLHCKAYKDAVLASSSCDLGPLFADVDVAAALPPFAQAAKPWDKNVQPPTQTVTE